MPWISKELTCNATTRKSDESSPNHVIIFTEVRDEERSKKKKEKVIIKRCTRDFTWEKKCLVRREWERPKILKYGGGLQQADKGSNG